MLWNDKSGHFDRVNCSFWFLTTLQLFKFLPMHPHLARLRLSQAHGDNTTTFAPCQEVFCEFLEIAKIGDSKTGLA